MCTTGIRRKNGIEKLVPSDSLDFIYLFELNIKFKNQMFMLGGSWDATRESCSTSNDKELLVFIVFYKMREHNFSVLWC